MTSKRQKTSNMDCLLALCVSLTCLIIEKNSPQSFHFHPHSRLLRNWAPLAWPPHYNDSHMVCFIANNYIISNHITQFIFYFNLPFSFTIFTATGTHPPFLLTSKAKPFLTSPNSPWPIVPFIWSLSRDISHSLLHANGTLLFSTLCSLLPVKGSPWIRWEYMSLGNIPRPDSRLVCFIGPVFVSKRWLYTALYPGMAGCFKV